MDFRKAHYFWSKVSKFFYSCSCVMDVPGCSEGTCPSSWDADPLPMWCEDWKSCVWPLALSGGLVSGHCCHTSPLPVFAESWSEWSDWSECDASGVQVRARQCVLLFPVGSQCSGNTTESRPCGFDSNYIPGTGREACQCGPNHFHHLERKWVLGGSFICPWRYCLVKQRWFSPPLWFQGN